MACPREEVAAFAVGPGNATVRRRLMTGLRCRLRYCYVAAMGRQRLGRTVTVLAIAGLAAVSAAAGRAQAHAWQLTAANVFGRAGIDVDEHAYGLSEMDGPPGSGRGLVRFATIMVFADHEYVDKGGACVSEDGQKGARAETYSYVSMTNKQVAWTYCTYSGQPSRNRMSYRAAYDRVNHNYPPKGQILNFTTWVESLGNQIAAADRASRGPSITHGEPTRILGHLSPSGLVGEITVDFAKPGAGHKKAIRMLAITLVTSSGKTRQSSVLGFYK